MQTTYKCVDKFLLEFWFLKTNTILYSSFSIEQQVVSFFKIFNIKIFLIFFNVTTYNFKNNFPPVYMSDIYIDR